jgi:hypothetical protein
MCAIGFKYTTLIQNHFIFLRVFILTYAGLYPPAYFYLTHINSAIAGIKILESLFRPYNARLTCERGRRPWPVGTRTEGTGVAFAQAKGMQAEARQVESRCYAAPIFLDRSSLL